MTALETDLLNPDPKIEQKKHKLKRLVQSPNSYFMDVKCPGCYVITTVFSHAQTVVVCGDCTMVLCQPTGGKARLTEGCSFRKKITSLSPVQVSAPGTKNVEVDIIQNDLEQPMQEIYTTNKHNADVDATTQSNSSAPKKTVPNVLHIVN